MKIFKNIRDLMEQVILVILAVGVVAVVLGILLKRLDVPPLVGYIF